jgi:peptide/nickel transport system ATP-binding protein
VMYAGRVVERGISETVTQHPAHPYTQLLVASAPDPDHLADAAVGARGEPPSLIDPPPGCRFNPRCPLASDVCRTKLPPLTEVASGHEVACWHVDEAGQQPRSHHGIAPTSQSSRPTRPDQSSTSTQVSQGQVSQASRPTTGEGEDR